VTYVPYTIPHKLYQRNRYLWYHWAMTHNELREAIKTALRAHDEVRLLVLRGLLTAITNELVTKGKKPTDEMPEDNITALVRRGAKQRRDSIAQFENGGRADLADKEKAELAILESFLPPQMPREEIEKAAQEKAASLDISDKTKANQLIGALMKDLGGIADGTTVKDVVDHLFV